MRRPKKKPPPAGRERASRRTQGVADCAGKGAGGLHAIVQIGERPAALVPAVAAHGADVLHAGIHGSESTLVVFPSLDAINEMKVLTSNYGAQYGRSASGTILVDTKTGGPSLHGSGYYYGRNEIFNSRNYFDQTLRAPPR